VDALTKFFTFYANEVNIVVVYISEAHANDEWPLSMKFKVNQHKSVEDRILAAKRYIDYYNVIYKERIFVDSYIEYNPNNYQYGHEKWEKNNKGSKDISKDGKDCKLEVNVERAFCCWPERGFVLDKELKFEYVAMARIEDLIRWPEEIDDWLERKYGKAELVENEKKELNENNEKKEVNENSEDSKNKENRNESENKKDSGGEEKKLKIES